MAGDWIKMRSDLAAHPKVFQLAEAIGQSEHFAIGALFCFWAWADKHAVDGRVDGATSRLVDAACRIDGLSAALVAIGWLSIDGRGIALPRFGEHNGDSAKERGLKNNRQARWRAGKDASVDGAVDGVPSTDASTREEKRREEKNKDKDLAATPLVNGCAADAYRVPDCDYEGIVQAYGEALAMLPQVALLTATRKTHMQARWREVCAAEKLTKADALAYFGRYFAYAARSPFLTGSGPPRAKGERAWRADMDWLMNPTNFAKVIEGNYHRRSA